MGAAVAVLGVIKSVIDLTHTIVRALTKVKRTISCDTSKFDKYKTIANQRLAVTASIPDRKAYCLTQLRNLRNLKDSMQQCGNEFPERVHKLVSRVTGIVEDACSKKSNFLSDDLSGKSKATLYKAQDTFETCLKTHYISFSKSDTERPSRGTCCNMEKYLNCTVKAAIDTGENVGSFITEYNKNVKQIVEKEFCNIDSPCDSSSTATYVTYSLYTIGILLVLLLILSRSRIF